MSIAKTAARHRMRRARLSPCLIFANDPALGEAAPLQEVRGAGSPPRNGTENLGEKGQNPGRVALNSSIMETTREVRLPMPPGSGGASGGCEGARTEIASMRSIPIAPKRDEGFGS
jgi:hypothetical protein